MSGFRRPEYFDLFLQLAKWLAIASVVGVLAGTASALFLLALEAATAWRESHAWVLWLLPVAGFGVGLVYHLLGKDVDAGNNLIIDEIHDPRKTLPLRMAPLVLGGTVIHTCSAPRSGARARRCRWAQPSPTN